MRPSLLILAPALVLALAACGGETESRKPERKGGGLPFGFELAAAATLDGEAAAVAELSPDEVAEALATGAIRLIDIRTDEEVAETGTIPGAEHIAMDRLDASLLDGGDVRAVVLYCRSGNRSLVAASRLAEETGKPVAHMPGGILAWQDRVRIAAACRKAGGEGC